MLFRDVVDLLVLEEGSNENGFDVIFEKNRQTVFANKKSVRSSEFYQASQSGYKVEIMFEMWTADYSNQKHLEYESKKYEVVRPYDRGEKIELVCQAYQENPL